MYNFWPFIVHEVLMAGTLGWFAIARFSRSGFVRTLCFDLAVLGGPAWHGSFTELHKFLCHDKAVILKPLTVWIMTSCGKLLQRWKYQTILPVS